MDENKKPFKYTYTVLKNGYIALTVKKKIVYTKQLSCVGRTRVEMSDDGKHFRVQGWATVMNLFTGIPLQPSRPIDHYESIFLGI